MAAAAVPLRTLQEWMGHRDFKTTLIYVGFHLQQAVELDRGAGVEAAEAATAWAADEITA